MARSRLDPYHVTPEEVRAAGASPGWYAMDDDGRMEIGPFATEQDAQRACDEANEKAGFQAIKTAQSTPPLIFVVYADVPGVAGGPVVLPSFGAADGDAAEAAMRRAEGMYRKELEGLNFSAEQVAGATFTVKAVN